MNVSTARVAALQAHIVVLAPYFLDKPASTAGHLADLNIHFEKMMLHLRRAVDCPDLDTLAPSLLALSVLQAKTEACHRRTALPSITKIRDAFEGVENFIETVPLAEPGSAPRLLQELGMPEQGMIGRLMQRMGFRTDLAQQASASSMLLSPVIPLSKSKRRMPASSRSAKRTVSQQKRPAKRIAA